MEALACGTLSIARPIGIVLQFPHVSYPVGDIARLKAILLQLAEQHRRQRACFAKHLKGIDWHGWAVKHEQLFRRLMCGDAACNIASEREKNAVAGFICHDAIIKLL